MYKKTGIALVLLFTLMGSAYAHKKRGLKCPEANLSDEQKETLRTMKREFRESLRGQALSREEKRTARKNFKQTILDTIPTNEEQKVALTECFNRTRGLKCPEANLSDEQKETLRTMKREFRESLRGQDLSREEKRTARKNFKQTILDTIPTNEEQKVALTECFNKRRNN